jgi:transcriptional regulator with XRE-family HTH domain
MSTIEQALSDFIDAWNAGRRPSVREHLARVPDGPQRDELAEQITTWLEVAPTPAYSDAARAQIRAEPAVRHVLDAVRGDAGLWPAVIPGLRARAGLTVGQLAARLVARFSLAPGSEERTADYLARLERGELEPSRVSRRLLGALGELLGASGDTLADAGRFAGGLRPAAAGGTLFRAEGEAGQWVARDLDALSAAAMRPAPPQLDELDRLFTGGADA